MNYLQGSAQAKESKTNVSPALPMIPDALSREKDKDLHDMLGMAHPLHRRRVCLGIQKIKDKEEEEVRAYARVGILVSFSPAASHEHCGRSESLSPPPSALASQTRA